MTNSKESGVHKILESLRRMLQEEQETGKQLPVDAGSVLREVTKIDPSALSRESGKEEKKNG